MAKTSLEVGNTEEAELFAGYNVPRETLKKLELYSCELLKWQSAKNLVSNSTLDTRWQRHIIDSAQLAPYISSHLDTDEKKKLPILLDIGSGAGFPGLVLAVMGLVEAHMVEANGRKSSFMSHISRLTGAQAQIHNERIESLSPFPADIITSRACASLDQLLSWSWPFTSKKTKLWFLKGEKLDEELTQAQASWKIDYEKYPSVTDSSGVLLEVLKLEKRE